MRLSPPPPPSIGQKFTGPPGSDLLSFPDSLSGTTKICKRRRSMIFGMSTATYTFIHVLISLVGIGSGLIVMFGFLAGKRMNGMTGLFLLTTVLTSVTGFGFPMDHGFTPGDKLGVISLVILAIAIPARYIFQMRGAWRWVYVVTASIALYLNVFVLVVQLFEKVPAIKALAPTQKEAPFAIAQLTVLLIFVVLTIFAVRKFHPDSAGTQSTRLAA
jgi:hypothetical protein